MTQLNTELLNRTIKEVEEVQCSGREDDECIFCSTQREIANSEEMANIYTNIIMNTLSAYGRLDPLKVLKAGMTAGFVYASLYHKNLKELEELEKLAK